MVRTQIQLDERQYEQVRRLAHREHLSFAEAVRRLLARGLGARAAPAGRSGPSALLDVSGVARGPRDLAARHDEYLAAEDG